MTVELCSAELMPAGKVAAIMKPTEAGFYFAFLAALLSAGDREKP